MARNTISDEQFSFNLQRFGHHHHGKSGGKIFATVLGLAIGCADPVLFGLARTANLAGAIMGASLFGSIWSATHSSNNNGSADVSRFDRAQETMSSDGQIPVVYGTRQITGNQTFHQTNADANTLHKHVVLCEGGIEGVLSVMANDMIIPTGSQTGNTVFTIINNKYKDARVRKHGSDFDLWAGNYHHHIHLCTKKEVEKSNDTYWEYQVSVTSLISYINQLYSEGWQAFPCAATNSYPGDLWDVEGVVYTETPFSKIFGNRSRWAQKNYVALNANEGFINFCADTVRGGTNYSYHDGDAPSNYNDVGGYPAMAWLDMNFIVSSELNGNPSVTAVVMGKKVYDIRTGKTEFSTNPAMCLRDFMLSERYGLGRWIKAEDLDNDSWKKAADYCDEEITFLDASGVQIRAKRFELNMVIDEKNDAIEWLKEILANFQAYLTLSNGKFKLHIEQKADVTYKFNDDNCFELSVAPLSLSDTPNKYDVKIIDPRQNWNSTSCIVEDYADQKERQKIITKEVNLNGTTSQYQALRLARFYRDQNLACPLNLSWKTGMQGMHLEPGDVVTVSYHGVFKDLPVRISTIKQNEEGQFEISGRQYNDTIYGDDLGGGVHWYNYTDTTVTPEKRVPSNPTNLNAYTQYRRYEDGSTGYDVIVTYDLPQRYDVNTGLVYYRTNHMTAEQIGTFKEGEAVDDLGLGREWIYAGDSPTKYTISGAKVGDIYQFRVLSRTTDGLISSEGTAPTTTIRVLAKETVPSRPYNLTYNFEKTFNFSWDDVPDSDVVYYEIRTDTNVGMPAGMLGKSQATSVDVKLSNREGDVYVYAVNAQKKYSFPAKVHYNYPMPDAPTNITFTKALRGMNIILPAKANLKARLYITSNSVSEVRELENFAYTYNGNPDIYTVKASYVDRMGEGYISAAYSFTITPTIDPDWIAEESLSLEKMDKTIKDAVKDAQDSIPNINKAVAELSKTDDEIKATVADGNKQLASQIKQNADSITSVVTNLGDIDKAKTSYSAIAQLQDGINLRVQKNDVINQINISSEGTTIDGKNLHITGQTQIDNNVIVNGMIAANAITADKLSADTIELTNSQGIKGGGATLDTNGLTVRANDGSYVVHGSNGMEFHDKNGNEFSMVGAMVMGTVKDGQWVKFTKPWATVPNVIVTPISLQLNKSTFNNQNMYLDCRAANVSENGFQCICRSVLLAGSNSAIPINRLVVSGSNEVSGEYTFDVPKEATNGVFTVNIGGWDASITVGIGPYGGGYNQQVETVFADFAREIHWYLNGNEISLEKTRFGETTKSISFPQGSVIKVVFKSYFLHYSWGEEMREPGTSTTWQSLWGNESYYNLKGKSTSRFTVVSMSYNTSIDTPISSGNAFFLCTDQHNSPYTISNS